MKHRQTLVTYLPTSWHLTVLADMVRSDVRPYAWIPPASPMAAILHSPDTARDFFWSLWFGYDLSGAGFDVFLLVATLRGLL